MASQETVIDNDLTDSDEKCVGENDLKKLKEAHFKAGVQEGIAAGTQSTLQDGFNHGYKEAFHKSHNFGKIRGVLSGLLSCISFNNQQNNYKTEQHKDRINKLLSELDNIEELHWKMVNDISVPNNLIVPNKSYNSNHLKQVNDLPEFKELLTECRQLCRELDFEIDIARILT